MADYSKFTRVELVNMIRARKLYGYGKLCKDGLIKMLDADDKEIKTISSAPKKPDPQIFPPTRVPPTSPIRIIGRFEFAEIHILAKQNNPPISNSIPKYPSVKIANSKPKKRYKKETPHIPHPFEIPAIPIRGPEPPIQVYNFKVVDLFAGTGAFSLAGMADNSFPNIQFETVFSNDICPNSKKIFDLNHLPNTPKLVKKNILEIPTEEIPKHDLLTAGFPCFVAGTQVMTVAGYKNIENIQPGNFVLTHTGKFQSVLNRQEKSGTMNLVKIRASQFLKPVVSTLEHPFYVSRNIGIENIHLAPPTWKNAGDIVPGYDWVGFPVSPNLHQFYNTISAVVEIVPCLKFMMYCNKIAFAGMAHNKTANSKTDLSIQYGFAWFPVLSTEIMGFTGTVYNLEVENDNSYLVEHITVHNCQIFSSTKNQQNFGDPRTNVFWKIIDIIQKHRPRWVILENAKNLQTRNGGKTFKTISESISQIGYQIKYRIFDTQDFGVPQHRERIYIVCFRDNADFVRFSFGIVPQIRAHFRDFLELEVAEKYYYTEDTETGAKLHAKVKNMCCIYQFWRNYVRENKSGICPTLTANMGSGGHNIPVVLDKKGVRKLTPREFFNLQGFPKSYKLPEIADKHLYKLAGDAVNLPIAKHILGRIKNSI